MPTIAICNQPSYPIAALTYHKCPLNTEVTKNLNIVMTSVLESRHSVSIFTTKLRTMITYKITNGYAHMAIKFQIKYSHIYVHHTYNVTQNIRVERQAWGCVQSVEWNGRMDHWNGILEWPKLYKFFDIIPCSVLRV